MSEGGASSRRDVGAVARRPAVAVAVLFMLGIALHDVLPHRPDVLLVMAGLLVAGAVIAFEWATVCSLCVACAILLCGIAAAQVERFFYAHDHVSAFATDVPRLARVELCLGEAPRLLTGAFGHFRALPPKQAMTARVVRIRTWDGWARAQGDVLAQVAQPHPRLAAGQIVPARWGNTSVTTCDRTAPHAVQLLNCVAHLDGDDDRAAPSGL